MTWMGCSEEKFRARDGVQRAVWAMALLVSAGCKGEPATDALDDGGVQDSAAPDASLPPTALEIYDEMREALRADPGYLRYEAERLVAARDAAGLHALVRDRVRTIPGGRDDWGPTGRYVMGPRGALRSGSGSLRDKAELLRELLERAGFEAELREYTDVPDDFTERALRPLELSSLQLDPQAVQRWKDTLQITDSFAPEIDADGTEASGWADRILAALPPDLDAPVFDPRPPPRAPIVRFRSVGEGDDAWVFAEVFLPDLPLGTLAGERTPGSALPAEASRPVTVELFLHRAIGSRPESLLQAEYESAELVGRQLVIGTPPADDPEVTLTRRIDSITTYLSTVALQGIDVDEEQAAERSVVGSAFTLAGRTVTTDDTGTVSVSGVPVVPSDEAPDLAQVTALEADASATQFPLVNIGFQVTTTMGLLESLPAASFQIEDDGVEVDWTLLQSASPPPKVLFVVDDSNSVPLEFRGAGLRLLLQDIAVDVQAAAPEALFRVHKISTSVTLNEWTADPAELDAQVDLGFAFGSDIWSTLGRSAETSPTVCVVITDGEATDEPTVGNEAGIRRLPPCVFLSVGADPATSVLPELTERVSGSLFEVSDAAAAKERVVSHAQERELSYRGEYLAPDRTVREHQVRVTLRTPEGSTAEPVEATARYTPHAVYPDSEITGLELVVRRFPERESRRWLIGTGDAAVSTEELQRALLAKRIVAFEGEQALLHERLDEVLTARLDHRPLYDAVAADDYEAMRSALALGVRQVPGEVWALMAPTRPATEGFVFQEGLRAVLAQDVLRSETEATRSIDILGSMGAGLRATASEGRSAFEASVRASLPLAVVERALFDESTLQALADSELVYLPPNASITSVAPELDRDAERAWDDAMDGLTHKHRVVPSSGAPIAFFAVEPDSGHTISVLSDRSGGGRRATELRAERERVIQFLNWLGFGGNIAGASTGFGFWIALQKAVAKQILTATIAIVELESPEPDESLPGTAADVACDGVKGVVGGAAGPVGTGIGILDSGWEAVTGEAAIPCF